MRELQSGQRRLEEQRAELVERLQAMLQAHWAEASQLLGATTLPPDLPVRTARSPAAEFCPRAHLGGGGPARVPSPRGTASSEVFLPRSRLAPPGPSPWARLSPPSPGGGGGGVSGACYQSCRVAAEL